MGSISIFQKVVNSEYKLVTVETTETERIKDSLLEFSIKMGKALYYWSSGNGLYRIGMNHILIPRTETPSQVLNYILKSNHFGIYLVEDCNKFFEDANNANNIIRIAAENQRVRKLILFMGQDINVPKSLEKLFLHIRHNTDRSTAKADKASIR